MFEQSMLLDSPPTKKAGALAASLGLQALGLGTMLLLPLIYSNQINFNPPPLPLVFFRGPRPVSDAPKVKPTVNTGRVPTERTWFTLFPAKPTSAPVSPPEIIGPDPIIFNSSAGGGPDISSGSMPPRVETLPPPPPPPTPLAPKVDPVPTGPVSMTSTILTAKIIRKVTPLYPPLAKAARVSGTVRLMGIIAKDGSIQQLRVLSGPPLLIKAAVDAVQQWLYSPTVLNGRPVEVIAPIDVVFTLAQ